VAEGDGRKGCLFPQGVWFQVVNLVSGPGEVWAHKTLKVTSLPYPYFKWELKFPEFSSLSYLLRHWKNLNPESLRKKILFSTALRLGLNSLWETRSAGQKGKTKHQQLDLFFRKEGKT
jgi:hypothetical protein